MFEVADEAGACSPLGGMRQRVLGLDQDVCDAERIDRIRQLEELKSACTAAQALETDAFAVSQRAEQQARGVPAERLGKGISAQVALARRISPFEASRYVGQVAVLIRELPATFECLARGEVPEWRVLLVARETAWLSAEHRLVLDAEIAPHLERLGKRKTIDLVNKIAYRLDPHGYVARLEKAEKDRHVSVRPASGSMARLSALLPLPQAVAAYAALHTAAQTITGVGPETRSRSQIMADLLVQRLTGQASATDISVQVNLIMTDQALFATGECPEEPATIIGGGTIPATLARRIITDTTGQAQVFLRRLYTNPTTGQLAAMDSHSRCFTTNQRHFLLLRDQSCRTPWCDAPVRHADHVIPAEDGGATTVDNGQGLCEACNYTKTAPGWRQQTDPTTNDIITTTPTGHTYRSRPPEPPRTHAAA
jgi:hypothetical protein